MFWKIKWYLLYGVRQWYRWKKYPPKNNVKIHWVNETDFLLILNTKE